MTTTLYVAGGIFISLFLGSLGYMIRLATKRGELEQKIEDDEIELEIQKRYIEIASRPAVDADAILERMRREANNK